MYPGAVRLRLLCAVCLLVPALAGCGGDEDAEIKTKADFVAAADKICVQRDERSATMDPVKTGGDLARLSRELAEIYGDSVKRVKALKLPPGQARAGAARYVEATVALTRPVEQMQAASEKLEDAVKAKQGGVLKEAAEELRSSVNALQALTEVADQAAREYGMHACGQAARSNPVS